MLITNHRKVLKYRQPETFSGGNRLPPRLSYTPLIQSKDEHVEEVTDNEEETIYSKNTNTVQNEAMTASAVGSNERPEMSEENKSLILHLLPTLKVGSDLSNVSLWPISNLNHASWQ